MASDEGTTLKLFFTYKSAFLSLYEEDTTPFSSSLLRRVGTEVGDQSSGVPDRDPGSSAWISRPTYLTLTDTVPH